MRNAHFCFRSLKFSRKLKNSNQGFTLIEILVVIGIIAVLAAIVVVAINPSRQFAQARNSQRISNVETILNAIGQNIADNKGVLTCDDSAVVVPTASGHYISEDDQDLWDCLVPTYMPAMVIDPLEGTCTPDSEEATYNTCYSIKRDSTTNRLTIAAPNAELEENISLSR